VYQMAPGDALDLIGFGSCAGGAAVRDGVVIIIWPTAAGVDPNFFVINYPLAELVGMAQ
jgi:hypothetical protein